MDDIPFFELKFDKKARMVDAAELLLIEQALKDNKFTDVIVLSHGWNNDMGEAGRLYDSLLQLIRPEIEKRNVTDRRFLAVGVFWPSKKFAEKDLIPGGAANVGADQDNAEAIIECKKLEDIADPETADLIKELRILLEEVSGADEISGKLLKVIESVNSSEGEESMEESFGAIERSQIE